MEYLFIYLCIYIKHALKLFFHHTHTGIISVEFLYVELCGALKQDYGLTALDVLLVSHSSIENTFLALLYYFFCSRPTSTSASEKVRLPTAFVSLQACSSDSLFSDLAFGPAFPSENTCKRPYGYCCLCMYSGWGLVVLVTLVQMLRDVWRRALHAHTHLQ